MCRLQLAVLARCQSVAAQTAQHAQDAVHGRADFVAHHGKKLGLGAVGRFCAFARFGMGADFAAQLHGLLGHQQLQLQPVTLQLDQVPVTFGGKGAVFDALEPEHLGRRFHFGDLVDALRQDAPHLFAMGKPVQRG